MLVPMVPMAAPRGKRSRSEAQLARVAAQPQLETPTMTIDGLAPNTLTETGSDDHLLRPKGSYLAKPRMDEEERA